MATTVDAPQKPYNPTIQRKTSTRQLGTPVILFALVLAAAGAIGMKAFDMPLLVFACIPAVLCAFVRPQFFLVLSIAFIPYTFSLSSGAPVELAKSATGGAAAAAAAPGAKVATGSAAAGAAPAASASADYGISDVLLLMALPGLVGMAISHPGRVRLGKVATPVFIYLMVGLASYLYNIPEMKGSFLPCLVAYVRSIQIILILPVVFMAVEWTPDELRGLVRAYLYGAFVMAVFGIVAFAGGMRSGLYILGNHKNGVGLALSFAVLIAVSLLTQPPDATKKEAGLTPEPLNINRKFLIAATALCSLGLLCSLSRGSVLCTLVGLLFISIFRRRGRIFATVLAIASLGFVGLIVLLPEKQVAYVSDYSTSNDNNHTRIDQSLLAWKRFEANPLLGDGYRTRREINPHNLEAALLGESGALGILTFFWLIATQTKMYARARRLFVGDPLREAMAIAFSTCALAILVHAQFDPYWRRGPLWLPWLGFGIVLAMAVQETKARRQIRAAAQAEEERIWRDQRQQRLAERRAELAARKAGALASQIHKNGAAL